MLQRVTYTTERRQADLFCKFSTEGVEGVLQALALLAVGGDHPHPGGLQPLLLLLVGLHQHAAELKEQGSRQICFILQPCANKQNF